MALNGERSHTLCQAGQPLGCHPLLSAEPRFVSHPLAPLGFVTVANLA
jgi:hypothetical protein